LNDGGEFGSPFDPRRFDAEDCDLGRAIAAGHEKDAGEIKAVQRSQHLRMEALVEGHPIDASGVAASFHCVDDQDAIRFFDVGEHIEKSSTRFDHCDISRKASLREGAGDVYAHTLIAEEEIAHAENQRVHD
jgi:hypothetical protein